MQLKDKTMLNKVDELEPTPFVKLLQAMSREDWTSVEAVLSHDIEWDMMPNLQNRKGIDAVLIFLKASWGAANGRVPTVINNVVLKDWGIMEYWNIGTIDEGIIEFAKHSEWPFPSDIMKKLGRSYKVPIAFIYHLNLQGKIDLVREYLDVGSVIAQFK